MDKKKLFNQNEYIKDYNKQKYDNRSIRFPKGKLEQIKAHAESRGESVNSFINRATDEAMKNDKNN